ncbi:MAG: hypothetical protein CM1200mP34_1480 [Verrucomicrobiales bacterium]|nr:MAG: hypothetical protein CM1200mP34_1480 [Verrucomicrobiales bacterium]
MRHPTGHRQRGGALGSSTPGIIPTRCLGQGKGAGLHQENPARIESGTFPTEKVVGGYDFAGGAYDGTQNAAPRKDPLDFAETATARMWPGSRQGWA